MNPLFKEILAGWLRKGLTALSAVLITRHVLTSEQGSSLSSMALNYAMDMIPLALSALWSYMTTRSARLKLLTAQMMPAGVTEQEVKERIASPIENPALTTSVDAVPVPKPTSGQY